MTYFDHGKFQWQTLSGTPQNVSKTNSQKVVRAKIDGTKNYNLP